jgi:single-strand DNA-binding protein
MNNLSNSVTLVGNLGRDVEVTTLDSGAKVANTSIATNRNYTNSSGEKVQEVEWHNVVAWNKTAELMERLLKKGNRVMLQGALKNETYKTKEGEIRYATKVRINEFQKLTLKEEAMPF